MIRGRECLEPDIENTTAQGSESSDASSLRERGVRVSFSSKRPPMAVVEAISRAYRNV